MGAATFCQRRFFKAGAKAWLGAGCARRPAGAAWSAAAQPPLTARAERSGRAQPHALAIKTTGKDFTQCESY